MIAFEQGAVQYFAIGSVRLLDQMGVTSATMGATANVVFSLFFLSFLLYGTVYPLGELIIQCFTW